MSDPKPFKYTRKPDDPSYCDAFSIGIQDGLIYFGFGMLTHEGSDKADPLGSFVLHIQNAKNLHKLLGQLVDTNAVNKALENSNIESFGKIQKPRFKE